MEPAAPSRQRHLAIRRLALAALVVGLVAVMLTSGLLETLNAVVLYLREAGPIAFFVAMALLPLVGIPLMPFTLVAGPAFGPVLGVGPVIFWAIVAVTVNVALSYGLAARFLRTPISRLAAFLGYQIPQTSGSWHIAAMIRLAPGLPFFAQSYLLGVMRVPFGSYMIVSVLVPAGYISGVVLLGDGLWQAQGRNVFFAVGILVLAGTALHFLAKNGSPPRGRSRPPSNRPRPGRPTGHKPLALLRHRTISTPVVFPMNTYAHPLRRALVAAAFALLSSLIPATAAAADSELGESAFTIAVPSGLSAAEVQNAIVVALSGRQWGVTSKTDDRVVAYLKHRSNEATVTFLYDTTKIDAFCVGWEINKKTGARKNPEQPKGWLKYLQNDINRLLIQASNTKV